MKIQSETIPRPPDKRRTAAPAPTGNGGKSGNRSPNHYNAAAASNQLTACQAAARAIEAGLVCLPDPMDMAPVLSRRLEIPKNRWLAESALLALPRAETEAVADEFLNLVRANDPVPPFMSIKDAAASWATFASRAEACHYLAAIWDRLPDDDRSRFLRRAV